MSSRICSRQAQGGSFAYNLAIEFRNAGQMPISARNADHTLAVGSETVVVGGGAGGGLSDGGGIVPVGGCSAFSGGLYPSYP